MVLTIFMSGGYCDDLLMSFILPLLCCDSTDFAWGGAVAANAAFICYNQSINDSTLLNKTLAYKAEWIRNRSE